MDKVKKKKKKSKARALGKFPVLDDDEFDPKYCKMRISMMLDLEIIEGFKALAEQTGAKYQTLMRDALRESLRQNRLDDLEKRLSRVEKALEDRI